MHGLFVIEGMNLSGHPWIINEISDQNSIEIPSYKQLNSAIVSNDFWCSANLTATTCM